MRLRLLSLPLIALLLAACQIQPPTQVVLVVTATPEASATASAAATDVGQATATATSRSATTPSPALATTPPMTTGPVATATPDIFPTATVGEIQIAEQLFQRGRMFWVQPTEQIWVLMVDGEGRGTWAIFPDTYADGTDPETDASIVPPDGLLQPTRGFGKLWRSNQEIRDSLGWATTPEFGYVSRYEYHPGGTVANGRYAPAPGYHILYSLYQEQFRFNEADNTWQLGGG